MRDLLIRHDRLSVDQVDRLKMRVDTNSLKLEAAKQARKDNWQEEADKISGLIEKDQAAIAAQLNRRIFIRAWYIWSNFSVLGGCSADRFVSVCGMSFVSSCTIGRTRSSLRLCGCSHGRSKTLLRMQLQLGLPWLRLWKTCLTNELTIPLLTRLLRKAEELNWKCGADSMSI